MNLVNVEGGDIVIRIPISGLSNSSLVPAELFNDFSEPLFKVTDAKAFSRAFIEELNHEDEDGSTPVTQLLDAVFLAAIENGADGVEELDQPIRKQNERTKRSR